MEKVRIGIIGVGNMGRGHFESIFTGKCPELVVTAAADILPSRFDFIKNMAPEGSVTFFNTAEEMMDSGLIDAVIIAIPHYDHPKYAIAAFKRGLHVMCEKPAGVYTKQVREMNQAAAQSDVVFGMMFNQRTNHIYRKMREIIASGQLGAIKRTNWIATDWYRPQFYYDSGEWRATWAGEGGGVLLNQCPHNMDLWQWICGMPTTVSAHMYFGKWRDIEVEDDVTAFVEYENGATGVFITTTADTPGTNRFEITCEKGKIVVEDGTLRVWELEMSEPEFSKNNRTAIFGRPACKEIEVTTDGQSKQHVQVLNVFAGAILHGTPLVASGEEGINGLMISNAMHLSAWLGKPVTLPLDEDLFYSELMKRVASSKVKENVVPTVADTAKSY